MKNKYRVLDHERPAKYPNVNVDSSWENCDFETEKKAREYANLWLGKYGPLPKNYKIGDTFDATYCNVSIVIISEIAIDKVLENISKAMESLDGEEITKIHNDVCSKKIRYLGDSVWEYTGEDD